MEYQGVTFATDTDQTMVKTKPLPLATEAVYEDLIYYINYEKIRKIKNLFNTYDCSAILNKSDIKCVDEMTPLITASRYGNVSIVQLLLDHGADINLRDKYGWTALMWAGENGYEANIELLLDNGADINVQNMKGMTALMCVSIRQYEDIVKLLLDNGADMNIQNKDGETALMQICSKWCYNINIVRLLIQYGTDINIQNNDGHTAYDLAKDTNIKRYLQWVADRNMLSYVLK